jgi:hypothetical protein
MQAETLRARRAIHPSGRVLVDSLCGSLNLKILAPVRLPVVPSDNDLLIMVWSVPDRRSGISWCHAPSLPAAEVAIDILIVGLKMIGCMQLKIIK